MFIYKKRVKTFMNMKGMKKVPFLFVEVICFPRFFFLENQVVFPLCDTLNLPVVGKPIQAWKAYFIIQEVAYLNGLEYIVNSEIKLIKYIYFSIAVFQQNRYFPVLDLMASNFFFLNVLKLPTPGQG